MTIILQEDTDKRRKHMAYMDDKKRIDGQSAPSIHPVQIEATWHDADGMALQILVGAEDEVTINDARFTHAQGKALAEWMMEQIAKMKVK